MVTKLDENIFFVKNICHSLTMLMIYGVFIKQPFAFIFDVNVIPQVNVRDLLFIIIGLPELFLSFAVILTVSILSTIDKFIHFSSFYENADFNEIVLTISPFNQKREFELLDLSNSFLYSDKTKSLLE